MQICVLLCLCNFLTDIVFYLMILNTLGYLIFNLDSDLPATYDLAYTPASSFVG